jgi:hypothetical protein
MKLVLQIVSGDQKCWQLYVYSDLSHQLAEGKSIWEKVIMSNESLCCQYSPAKKCQSMQWKTSISVRQNRHMSPAHVEAVLICFLIIRALFASSSFDKVREWTRAVALEILALLLEALYRWRYEFGLVLRSCITTMFVLTHHCTGDWHKNCATSDCLQNWRMLWRATITIVDIQGHEEHYWRGVQHCCEWWKHTPSVLLCKGATLKGYLVQLLQGHSKN